MSRLARLTMLTTVLSLLAITAGGLVRATDSGEGCPGWPRCYGRWIPPADHHAIIEMAHRYLVSISIWAAVGVCAAAVLWHRRDRVTLTCSLAIVPLFAAQAGLGAYVVSSGLQPWTVVAHLGLALLLLATLIGLTVHLVVPSGVGDARLARLSAAGALAVYGLALLGSYVTGRDAGLVFTDWPLMGGRLVPTGLDQLPPFLHFAHRLAAVVAGLLVGYIVLEARRRGSVLVRRLATVAGSLFLLEVAIGGLNVFSRLHSAVVTTHLAVSALIWSTLVALAAVARRTPAPAGDVELEVSADAATLTRRERVLAYVALTKPRIVELLLVTTVPTMVVAERGVPSGWLVAAVLLGGSLAAGGANAINMFVDRYIDRVMRRTRGRPLARGILHPYDALFFGITLNALAFVELWSLVNPLSAVLAVSATLFYVFVYTLWLKRSSVSNIVIGGAAGAVPVLVGWAVVTGSLGLAPLVLFAIVFWWTPPHFWALAIRYREDYASADIPMLPVVRSLRETARQIVLYTVLLWVVTLVFHPVGHMGNLYLGAALVLGGAFTYQAVQLMRQGSGQTAMRLFGYSISYLTLLFGAMAADQLLRAA